MLFWDVKVIEFTAQTRADSTVWDLPALLAYELHKNKNNKYNFFFISFSCRGYVQLHLSLSLIKRQTIKIYGGGEWRNILIFLTSVLIEVTCQFHALADLSPGKEPLIPAEYDAWWDQEKSRKFCRTEKSLSSVGNRTLFPRLSTPYPIRNTDVDAPRNLIWKKIILRMLQHKGAKILMDLNQSGCTKSTHWRLGTLEHYQYLRQRKTK
jgi:hypothetical protein